jgi:hypothetical protein
MPLDLDTFLTTVYCLVDDLYRAEFAPHKPMRPGRRPQLSDSEVLTLVALAQWHPSRSERRFLTYARTHWRAYFPRVLDQSAFNRRARDLLGVLCRLAPRLAAHLEQQLGQAAPYAVLDGVPVPLLQRCRGARRKLFTAEQADFGQGGSDKSWYYGVAMLAEVNAQGAFTGFVCGPASCGERWLLETLLRWRCSPTAPAPTAAELAPLLGPSHRAGGGRRGPTGRLAPRVGVGVPAQRPELSDQGFAGAAWEPHWATAYGATVLHKGHYRSLPPAERHAWAYWLSGRRQQVETAFHWLTDTFGLKFPRARTDWGLFTRLAAKLVAFNLGVTLNYGYDRPPFAFFHPFDQ